MQIYSHFVLIVVLIVILVILIVLVVVLHTGTPFLL